MIRYISVRLTLLTSLVGVVGCLSSETPPAERPASTPPNASATKSTPAVCHATGAGPVLEMQLARCLAVPPLPSTTPGAPRPVVLYLDRSASMQGFLDPEYPRTRTDFRSVLDAIVVGLKPARAYSYGASIKPIDPNLGVVGNKGFYSDLDTKVEDVIAQVARDTDDLETHILIGDGRRGTPDRANGQFVSMRTAADAWIARGGTLLVATSSAPFKTVASDPSGCRRGAEKVGEPQVCPLYAFAFVARGDELRIASAVSEAFEHVFAWPAMTVPSNALLITAPAGSHAVLFERRWQTSADGTPVARAQGQNATNDVLRTEIRVADTASLTGRTYRALLSGQKNTLSLSSRALSADAMDRDWGAVSGRASPVTTLADTPLSLGIVTRGAGAPRSIVRVDVAPSGVPSWLEQFDAQSASDAVRTYGLGRLFESSRQDALRNPVPIARLYVVVN